MASAADMDALESQFYYFCNLGLGSKKRTTITNSNLKKLFDGCNLYGDYLTEADTDIAVCKVKDESKGEISFDQFRTLLKEVAPKYEKDHEGQFATADAAYNAMAWDVIGRRRKNEMENPLEELAKIEAIYAFDPAILSQDPYRTSPLNFKDSNIEDVSFWIKFYSSRADLRDQAYQRKIEEPLLKILNAVGEECLYWSGNAKHVALFRYLNKAEIDYRCADLTKVATVEIFSHPTEGLSALRKAIEDIQRSHGDLTSVNLEELRLLRTLAGFIYDQQALEKSIEIARSIHTYNPSEWKVKLAMLRFVQVTGEYFERLLPSTLSLNPDIPNSIIKDLRDRLAHLSKSKLEKMQDTSTETNNIFNSVQEDIRSLLTILQGIQNEYEEMSRQGPEKLWHQLQTPKATKSLDSALWPGFRRLQEWLQPQRQCGEPTRSISPYGPEIEELLPFPVYHLTPSQLNDHIAKRQALMDTLGRAKDNSISHDEFVKDLRMATSELSADYILTEESCEALWADLKRLNGEIAACSDSKKKKEKIDELSERKRSFIYEVMGAKTEDDIRCREEEKEQHEANREIEKRRKALNDLLRQVKPCCGFGNISHKYKEFWEKLEDKKNGVDSAVLVNGRIFSWYSEPQSAIEKLFHKVHKTGIATKADKDNLRRERIKEILEVVEELRETAGIQTDFNLKICKEADLECVSGKIQLMEKAIGSLRDDERTTKQELGALKAQLQAICEQIRNTKTSQGVTELCYGVEPTLKDFLVKLEAVQPQKFTTNVDISSLKRDLGNTARRKYYGEILQRIEVERVKKNHRFHKPDQVTTTLTGSLKNDHASLLAHQLFVASIYEMLKETSDYPELACLRNTVRIRNYFCHPKPFGYDPLIVNDNPLDDGGISLNAEEQLAKEVSILSVNVKFILEDFAASLPMC